MSTTAYSFVNDYSADMCRMGDSTAFVGSLTVIYILDNYLRTSVCESQTESGSCLCDIKIFLFYTSSLLQETTRREVVRRLNTLY